MIPATLIVNPASAGGRTAREWPEIARRAAAHGLEPDVRLTERPGHATELTRRALRAGAALIVAVGGDGTVSEVVNGFYDGDEPVAPQAELAVICRGSGCDLIRTFGISKHTDAALRVAAQGSARTIDLGRVAFTARDGTPGSRLFANISSAGLTGVAAERASHSSNRFGATVGFAWAAVSAFVSYRNTPIRVEADEQVRELVSNNVIVANCRYFAGGMRILPAAEPDDGLFDVLIWGDVSKADLARNLHRLYRGTHVTHPKAEILRARRVVVTPEVPLPIEADGELPGLTPATFEVVPSALRLRAPG
ncbi:MAG: diacylglycerol/lipid kinase family protein [Gaiellales bacterium]